MVPNQPTWTSLRPNVPTAIRTDLKFLNARFEILNFENFLRIKICENFKIQIVVFIFIKHSRIGSYGMMCSKPAIILYSV